MADLRRELQVFEQKHNCVQEELPYCTDACPLHVDVRQMMLDVQAGKTGNAFERYRKTVLFPGILSRTCGAPCRGACLRGEYDEALAVREVERALVEHAQRQSRPHYVRKKGKSVAVVGAGLSGLACAVALGQKGYEVTVYEKNAAPGGSILRHPGLAKPVAADEIAERLAELDIRLHCRTALQEYCLPAADAVLLATGGESRALWPGVANLDPATLQVGGGNLFAAGALASSRLTGAAGRIADGKTAASSIDRFLSGSALAAGESSCTRLFTPRRDVRATPAVRPGSPGVYSPEEACTEAGRCLLCECKACIPHCRFLEEGLQSPKQYIVEAQQSLRTLKLIQSKLKARRTNGCNLCGLCREYCPNGVDMGEVYLYSRRIMHKRDELPPAFHEFWLEDMAFSASGEAFFTCAPIGRETADYLFFPGCQMGGANPLYVKDTYRYLENALPGGVGLYLGCCGAPSEWAGYEERTEAETARFHKIHEEMGRPRVILACPTCEKMFAKYHPDAQTVSLWSVFAQRGLPPAAANGNGAAAVVFDPCASRYAPESQRDIRQLACRMGYSVEELAHHGRFAQCCGYGGLISASNPGLAERVAADRVSESPFAYISYCVNCCETFRKEGKPALHILDLLFGYDSDIAAPKPPVGISARRENRRRLRRDMQAEWGKGGEPVEEKAWQAIRLEIPPALRAKMEKSLILEECLQRAVFAAENGGGKLDGGTGFITHLRIGHVTYWVGYTPLANGAFCVDNTYCHRMQIEEENGL